MSKEYQEGAEAAKKRVPFSDCPYAFVRVCCSKEKFEIEWRYKLDHWFNGWRDTLDARGLGFNFKPKKGERK